MDQVLVVHHVARKQSRSIHRETEELNLFIQKTTQGSFKFTSKSLRTFQVLSEFLIRKLSVFFVLGQYLCLVAVDTFEVLGH